MSKWQEALEDANRQAVTSIPKDRVAEWIKVAENDLDPRWVDGWLTIAYLFTERNDKWPIMDSITKPIFLKYARLKLAGKPLK